MAAIASYFSDFLSEIRLTESQVEDCITGHSTLRKRLLEDEVSLPPSVGQFSA
jgi:hypothetical protein